MDDGWWMFYAVWLLAGLVDFRCHRRSRLSSTSGVAEAALHITQIGLIAVAVTLALAFQPSGLLAGLIGILVGGHTFVGYLDTRTAYGVRDITPLEQHVHSVLDVAPWIAYAAFVTHAAPLEAAGGALSWHEPSLPSWVWASVMSPAIVLCVVPASVELVQALSAASRRRGGK